MMAARSIKVFILLSMLGCTQAVDTLTARVLDGVAGQQSPCIGQDVVLTCTFPAGRTFVDMIVRAENEDETSLTLNVDRPMRTAIIRGNTLIANLTNDTSAELLIEAIDAFLNRSTVTCEVSSTQSHSLTVFVLGTASGPVSTFDSNTQRSFEGIDVAIQRPVYGWECVNSYTVIVQSNADDIIETVNVTTPDQLTTVVSLSGLDMCRNTYSLTTFATSNGDRGRNFTLQGPYSANPSVLSDVVIATSNSLPLTMMLSWNLEPSPQPADCVTNYSLSFNSIRMVISNTSVLPNELLDNGFPLCINQSLKISPIVPILGEVDSSSTTVMIRVEEGFQAPQEVMLGMFNLSFDDTTLELRFGFEVKWDQATSVEVSASVGFATGSQTCIPSSSSRSRNSHTFALLNPQLFVGVPVRGCVSLRKSDCTSSTNESTRMNAPIAITASSLVSHGEDGFETTITRYPNLGAVNDLRVTIAPDAQSSVVANGDMFTVSFFDLKNDITYSFSIQAEDVEGAAVGIPITGTFRMVPSLLCGTGCIVGIVICVVLLIVVIIVIVLLIIFRYVFHQWCHRHCVCECCSCCSEVEETDTHELKSGTDNSSSEHEQAPEYAVVDKSKKSKDVKDTKFPVVGDTLYQDPTSIQHETAPTGDVYAVTEKKPKKKGPTEVELAQMYSIPDKSKGGGLTYASLDMPGGGGDSEASKRSAPTEYATVIN